MLVFYFRFLRYAMHLCLYGWHATAIKCSIEDIYDLTRSKPALTWLHCHMLVHKATVTTDPQWYRLWLNHLNNRVNNGRNVWAQNVLLEITHFYSSASNASTCYTFCIDIVAMPRVAILYHDCIPVSLVLYHDWYWVFGSFESASMQDQHRCRIATASM